MQTKTVGPLPEPGQLLLGGGGLPNFQCVTENNNKKEQQKFLVKPNRLTDGSTAEDHCRGPGSGSRSRAGWTDNRLPVTTAQILQRSCWVQGPSLHSLSVESPAVLHVPKLPR